MEMVAGPAPAAKNPEKSSTCLNLGQINRCNFQVTNIPRYFRTTGKFSPVFPPKSVPLGANLCRYKKISATLLTKLIDITHFTQVSHRRGPRKFPFCPIFVPFMCRFAARRLQRRAVSCRIPLDYSIEKEISSKDGTIDPEISSKSFSLMFF